MSCNCMYQSQSDKERFCRHYTVNREHALPVKIMVTMHVVNSRFRSIFCCFLSYFVKPSWAPIKQLLTKLLTRFRRILDNTLFRNKAANLDLSRAAQLNCSENHFVEKTNQYHTCCFGILHGTTCNICPLGVHLGE